MPRILRSNAEIIDAFGMRRFGEICGHERHPVQRASDMRRRNSIPGRYWANIVAAAPEHGLSLTLEMLAQAQPKKPPRPKVVARKPRAQVAA